MDRNFLVAVAAQALNDLGGARQEWVSTVMTLTARKDGLALADAIAKKKATEAAGGPKGLGSNADLREQALIIALANDTEYGFAKGRYEDAFEAEARAKQVVHTLDDTLKLFKVFLETDIG